MHRTGTRIACLITACILVAVQFALSEDVPSISHTPIPIALKGKPLPIIATVGDNGGAIQSVTLLLRSSENAAEAKIEMKADDKGVYSAMIPPKSTSGEGLVYQISVVAEKGTSSTAWYPVKTEDLKDKATDEAKDEVQDSAKEQVKKTSRIAKAKAAMVAHPYIAAGAAVGTVGVAAAAGGGGGGGGGGGDNEEPSPFQGSLSGSWSGSGLSGSFSVTISSSGAVSGSYSGDMSGGLSGSVSQDGSFTASGSAGGASWRGTVSGAPGNLSASGTWTGYTFSGTWSGHGG